MRDDHWFDRFNRALTSPAPRRQVLRAIGPLMTGASLSAAPSFARKPARKKTKRQPGARCGQQECAQHFTSADDVDSCVIKCGRCRLGERSCIVAADAEHADTHATCCFEHQACCDGACVDVADDINNCGRCGKVCGAGELCIGGDCAPSHLCNGDDCVPSTLPCDAGETRCPPQGCVDTRTHVGHCGTCGNACTVGGLRYCVNGRCSCNPASDNVPCGINCIPRGFTCCPGNGGYGCSNPNAVCRDDGGCGAPRT